MKFLLALLICVLLIVALVYVCTKGSSVSSKQEDYLRECARQKLIQQQEEDNNLD